MLAHVAQRVCRALAVELVDRDEVGEVEHVDFFELACCAELGRHHIKRHIDMRDDRRIPLADARCLDDDQVVTRGLAGGHRVGKRLGNLACRVARSERAHIDVRWLSARMDRIHADPVAEQRATGFSPRRVDRDDRNPEIVILVEAEAADELVGQRAFARPSRAGDAENGRFARFCHAQQFVPQLRRHSPRLEAGNHSRQRLAGEPCVAAFERGDVRRKVVTQIDVARADDLVDHALQAQTLAILGRKNACHAVGVQLLDLRRNDYAATAAEDLDVPAAALAQQVEHVLEELDVAALVRRDRDAVRIFLQRAGDDLLDRTVVPEMDHLASARLQDAAHDVN